MSSYRGRAGRFFPFFGSFGLPLEAEVELVPPSCLEAPFFESLPPAFPFAFSLPPRPALPESGEVENLPETSSSRATFFFFDGPRPYRLPLRALRLRGTGGVGSLPLLL